jgi:hypothetical protein
MTPGNPGATDKCLTCVPLDARIKSEHDDFCVVCAIAMTGTHKKAPEKRRGFFFVAVARRQWARRCSITAFFIDFCSFSKARTSIWRTRSREMP